MKKRKFLSLALALVLGLSLPGCANNASKAESEKGSAAAGETEAEKEGAEKKETSEGLKEMKLPTFLAGENVGAKFFLPQVERFNKKYEGKYKITVEEVVEMASYKKRGWFLPIRNEDREKRDKALEEMGLTELRKRQISQLSGGQKQKVFLARALAEEAKLFLLDEPFAAIDQKSERSITEKLKEFKKMGKTILCIHHDLSRLQENFDYILWIKAGSYGFGRAEEVLSPENVEAIFSY